MTLAALLGASACVRGQETGEVKPQERERGQVTALGQDGLQLPVGDEVRVTPVVRAVRAAAPSVVSIRTGRTALIGNSYFQERRDVTQGQGSGVIVDKDGLVITNWHVIWNPAANDRDGFTKVILRDGREFDAEVVNASAKDDLALLRIKNAGDARFTPIVMGHSSNLMIGETVIAIGNPAGQQNTVTTGVLSATGREIQVPWPDGTVHKFQSLLQTDAAINPGNSGGALLDITGKLIGINNAIRTDTTGINYAIPVDRVHEVFLNDLLSSDGSAKFWLGMRTAAARDDKGVVVARIDQGGPAIDAGIAQGDRILAVNGRPVADTLEFTKRLLELDAGQTAGLEVQRGSRKFDAELRLVPRDEGALLRLAGLQVSRLTAGENSRLLRKASALLIPRGWSGSLPVAWQITQVTRGSAADTIGLRAGDVLGLMFRPDNWGSWSPSPLPPTLGDLVGMLRVYARNNEPLRFRILRGDEAHEGELLPKLDER